MSEADFIRSEIAFYRQQADEVKQAMLDHSRNQAIVDSLRTTRVGHLASILRLKAKLQEIEELTAPGGTGH